MTLPLVEASLSDGAAIPPAAENSAAAPSGVVEVLGVPRDPSLGPLRPMPRPSYLSCRGARHDGCRTNQAKLGE